MGLHSDQGLPRLIIATCKKAELYHRLFNEVEFLTKCIMAPHQTSPNKHPGQPHDLGHEI